jgi:hypothetical protein
MPSFKPKDIEDLADIMYNPERSGDKEKYLSMTNTKLLSPNYEKEINTIFKDLEFKKIPTKEIKTFDFVENKKEILSEITTITFGDKTNLNKLDPTSKISKAIEHLGEKDSSEYPNYLRGGIIHYDSSLAYLVPELVDEIQNNAFVTSELDKNNLDYLLFKPIDSTLSPSMPAIMYVKKGQISKFGKIPDGAILVEI